MARIDLGNNLLKKLSDSFMNILIINTYHYLRGGDCRHALGLGTLLEKCGQKVHYFAMKGEMNLPCSDEDYFVSEIDYRLAVKRKNPINALKVLWHSVYSFEAKEKIAGLIDNIQPDIVHIHSIRHHLTKSILPEIAKRNIPIVWTLHDFKELCPNTSFYNGNEICERCNNGSYIHVLLKKCKRNSLTASLVTYIEALVNDRKRYDKYIDLYISPSMFLKNKFVEYGFNPEKLINVPNFIQLEKFSPHYEYEDYVICLGRLENGKGLETLIKGFTLANFKNPSFALKIVGTGSWEGVLKEIIEKIGASEIELLGYKQGDELENLTKWAKALIIPSEFYENYPYSGLEAMAYGKPIIASRIGGIPEQVEDGVTGFLFEAFNEKQLAEKINLLNNLHKEEIKEMGQRARQKVEKINNQEIYLSKILNIYDELIERKRNFKKVNKN